MSKMDDLRAMREARYARAAAGSGRPAARRTVAPTAAAPEAPAPAAPAAPGDDRAEPALCGHRSMNGRTCTREHGHEAKNHRYS